MSINQEKQDIISLEGNVLVIANPGTGKTKLLAHKYVDLLQKGVPAEQILCLTFTHKAKKVMENRILELIKEEKIKFDVSNLKVFTFHSYALDNLEEKEILSSNLLRFSIYKYLKDNEILTYGEDYLRDTIVPKIESLIRYLKSFGITPDQIDSSEVKSKLAPDKKYSKEELEKFTDAFIGIFRNYEEVKNKKGLDYSDMLIRFLSQKELPQFEYVLVDELQDVNILEADIALRSCKNFVAVGDKKQAIFGFQGGSILNFRKFMDSKQKVLSENFRSTDEILTYAKEYFIAKTKDESHKKDLKDLKSAKASKGPKPVIYDTQNAYSAAAELAKGMKGTVAIITRTNYQILDAARELKARDMEFSSTFYSASDDAKSQIISFLKGVLGSDVQEMKNSMFTSFFPITMQEAFIIAQERYIQKDEFINKISAFKRLRESVKTVEDVNRLFLSHIIPICISYGKEYLTAARTVQEAYVEALRVIDDKNISDMLTYLLSSDLLSEEADVEKKIILTTVHKAKGKEFENVIYIPSKPNDQSNFADKVVEAILESKGILAKEELEEETLRVNFVAFTRAEKNLVILADKIQEYLNDYSELKEFKAEALDGIDINESQKRAFNLFVNGQFDEAKRLLENKDKWLKEFIKNHFASLEHTSFSNLPENAYDYFLNQILNIKVFSVATNLGSDVHKAAENMLRGDKPVVTDETKKYVSNVKQILTDIKKRYPETPKAEKKLYLPLSKLGFKSDLFFKGYIDAVLKNGEEYLLMDWKTDKATDKASEHRQQLSIYRKAFAAENEISEDKVKVALGFVGLRGAINTGEIGYVLDEKQPSALAFGTVSKRIERLLSWIESPDKFLEEFLKDPVDDVIWRSVKEEVEKERMRDLNEN